MSQSRVLSRRFRLALLAAAALAAASVVTGYAPARNRTTPAGTGVVVIDTNLAYQGGAAAGTGMVLTSSGEILTNNHVVRGATSIRIVVPGTGSTYAAKVVGYDVTDDVAVLQAAGAANLRTVSLGTSAELKVGRTVKAVGNAGGNGSLVTSTGVVTGLGRTITVSDDSGGTATLRNLIETDAALEPGDSGGPLLDAAGKVVGMDSAASVSSGFRDVASRDGYAIPIDRAAAIARRILAGKASATVHVGGTPFLGISAASTGSLPGHGYPAAGVVVVSVVPGGPADEAGLVPGDLITAIGGRAAASPAAVASLVLAKKPGATVAVTYVDAAGATHSARVTFASGPPQ